MDPDVQKRISKANVPKVSPNRILCVRLSSLGDLVHTVPVIPALRSSFPEAEIDWVVNERWSPLMKLVCGINQVVPLRGSISGYLQCMKRVRETGYSFAIDFQGIYRSAMLAWASGAKMRIGRDRNSARERGAARFYSDCVSPSGKHVAEMSMSLAERAGARVQGTMQFPIEVPAREVGRVRDHLNRHGIADYIVVSPGGGWKSKCWPAERFGALCAELWASHGIPLVINIAPGETELAEAVRAYSQPAKPMIYCPELRELVALLSGALLVVGGDTGPLHLAAALGAPVVALFGATNAARNGPLPHGVVVQNQSSSDLSNYQRGNYLRGRSSSPEMLSITVGEVLEAVEQQLRKSSVTDLRQ
jgi:lipopolysaccharide heptosyltransferase I